MTTPTAELVKLLASMSPQFIDGEFVFCSLKDEFSTFIDLDPFCMLKEGDSTSLVLKLENARAAKLNVDVVFKGITLQVNSSLTAVGFTAAFASELAACGIGANVIAGFQHDHIFVPKCHADRALTALHDLSLRYATASNKNEN